MLMRIANTTGENGYKEQLFKSDKRYYRIVRTERGEWYSIYVNDSEYGEPENDTPMYFNNRRVKECTIAECKESIRVYEMMN